MKKKILIFCFCILASLTKCGGSNTDGTNSSNSNTNTDTSNNSDITLANDHQKPTLSIIINDNEPTTSSSQVQLKIDGADNSKVIAYFISQTNRTPEVNDRNWVLLPEPAPTIHYILNNYVLPLGGGTKNIFVWLKDAADNISDVATGSIDTWSFQDLSNFCGDTANVDMALGPDNKVHIVCESSNRTYYLTNQNGQWISGLLSNNTFPPAIAVDSQSVVHVISIAFYINYLRVPTAYLVYARKEPNGTWNFSNITNISPGEFIGFRGTSLAIDNDDKLHVLVFRSGNFSSSNNAFLWYLNNISGSWQIDTSVDSSFNFADDLYASLAVDFNGKPHLCYSQNGRLIYNNKTGSAWNKLSSTTLRDGVNCSIALDNTNTNYIAYHSLANALGIISFDTRIGGNNFSSIHDAGDIEAGKNMSLAFNHSNKLNLVYYDRLNNILYYSNPKNTSDGEWFNMEVDSAGIRSEFPIKLLMDSNNKLHLIYYKMPGTKLTYATTAE